MAIGATQYSCCQVYSDVPETVNLAGNSVSF
jgi:hypothetical protein